LPAAARAFPSPFSRANQLREMAARAKTLEITETRWLVITTSNHDIAIGRGAGGTSHISSGWVLAPTTTPLWLAGTSPQ
jgi:hypothetical protein